MNVARNLTAIWLVSRLAWPVLAEQSDPTQILKQAAAAAKAVTAIAYRAESHAEGDLRDELERVTGIVRAQRVSDLPVPKLDLQAEVFDPGFDEPLRLRFIHEGTRFARLDAERRIATLGDPPESLAEFSRFLGPARVVWLPGLFAPNPFESERSAKTLAYHGTATVGDAECDVVRISDKSTTQQTRWYFAKSDHLLRRVERVESRGVQVLTISELKVNPPLAPDAFTIKVPDGYTVRNTALLPVGSPAPNWSLQSSDGRAVSLESLRGNVVVLDFWATWCAPCKAAMPGVQKLHERFNGKPVRIFGVTWNDRGDPVGYMKEKGYTYGLLLNGERISKEYRINGVPVFYVIGPNGKILYRRSGYDPKAEHKLVEAIERALRAAP